MDILIRADASIEIGSGHVMRCLTVANKLRSKGHNITFIMGDLPGNLINYVNSLGYTIINHLIHADVCIIDHYLIDVKWEQLVRTYVNKIIVIDDLANRVHDCDLLIDQNLVANYEHRYDTLVPNHCVKLLGPRYLILRDEFINARKTIKFRSGIVKNILVFMGGSDPTGETKKVIHALSDLCKVGSKGLVKDQSLFDRIDVVVGMGNPDRNYIKLKSSELGFHYHCQINYLASLMVQADFSIGAGGSSTWERCYLGLPSSSTIVAQNQLETTEMAAYSGVVWNLGWHESVNTETYKQLLLTLNEHNEVLSNMSMLGLKLTGNEINEPTWLIPLLEVVNGYDENSDWE
ncbi:UDP-2,4-diacetamido-2,4,6-trideoxy-beta-L-altropyranose hydrolase [Robertmurraya sp. GLU-23]